MENKSISKQDDILNIWAKVIVLSSLLVATITCSILSIVVQMVIHNVQDVSVTKMSAIGIFLTMSSFLNVLASSASCFIWVKKDKSVVFKIFLVVNLLLMIFMITIHFLIINGVLL